MSSSPIWTPRTILSLNYTSSLLCVGMSRSSHRRCIRPIPSTDPSNIDTLLADMSLQMPDQIDHQVLLRLAKACLCVEKHRGKAEANVIYRWTELLSTEAEAIRQRDDKAVSVAAESFQSSPIFENHVHTACCSPLAPQAMRPVQQPRLLTNLITDLSNNPLTMATPKPMELSEVEEAWDNETLVPSPGFASPPLSRTPAALTLVPFADVTNVPAEHLPPTPPDSATTGNAVFSPRLSSNSTPRTTSTGPSSIFSQDVTRETTLQRNPLQILPLATPSFVPMDEFVKLLRETQEQHAKLLRKTEELSEEVEALKWCERGNGSIPVFLAVMLVLQVLSFTSQEGFSTSDQVSLTSLLGGACICLWIAPARVSMLSGYLERGFHWLYRREDSSMDTSSTLSGRG